MSPHPGRWLTLIGLGEDGLDGLSPAARRVLADAELVVGGERHLGLVGLGTHGVAPLAFAAADLPPTPLAGEGARRADEGGGGETRIEAAPRAEPAADRSSERSPGTSGSAGISTPSSGLRPPSPARGEGGDRCEASPDAASPHILAWPSPLTDAIPAILARRGRPVVVLASGDPFFFGVGTTLLRHIPADEVACLPAPSAFSLAAARVGWPLQDCTLVSLHGRSFERVLPHLQPGARLIALSWDGSTPARLAAALTERGMGDALLTVMEARGGPRERLRTAPAAAFDLADVGPLNTIAVEIGRGPGARSIALTPGLPDDAFEHDGQITKREIRAVTLAALAPRRGELLWDIGAGSGSIGIEWMLADPHNRTIAVEARPDRAARVARNALALGVPDLAVIEGQAPTALAGLPAPDAVFIGGGAGDAGVVAAVWDALRPGGRLVVNAVTLETQAQLTALCLDKGGELVSLSVARAVPVGGFLGWKPAMPVVQWRVEKP